MNEEAELTLEYFKSPECKAKGWTNGVPRDHWGSSLANFENRYSKSTSKFWSQLRDITKRILTKDLKQCPRYVFLCGSPGSGKTHFEAGLYQALLYKFIYAGAGGVWYTTFTHIMQDIHEDYSEQIRIKEALEGCVRKSVGAYTIEDFLFIDDFTASEKVFKRDSMEHIALQQLILNRWDTGRTLITSTNLPGDMLIETLGKVYTTHIASRLENSVIIDFPNQDFRKGKK